MFFKKDISKTWTEKPEFNKTGQEVPTEGP